MTIKVGTYTLSEQGYDHRDYIAGNILKNFDKLIPPEKLMRGISETYYQGRLGACTAFATTHSVKSQNEKEYKKPISLEMLDLRKNMGHSLTKYDGGDSVENAVKMALKNGIKGTKDGHVYLYQSDAWCYGKWNNWQQGLMLFPLIIVIKGESKTWIEMLDGEVKTIKRGTQGHAILLAGYDKNWVYFYNSFGDRINKGGISNFKISRSNFDLAIGNSMVSWRWFGLVDKKDLVDYAKEIELSKQIIVAAKKLYDIGDQETKSYFIKIGLSDYLTKKYGFTI